VTDQVFDSAGFYCGDDYLMLSLEERLDRFFAGALIQWIRL
jgi:hypothetical protein